MTFDGQSARLYVDGVIVSEAGPTSYGVYELANNRRIGGSPGDTNHFRGSIDEVRLYERALSPDEVMQLATRG